jgi:hypothetical protein
MAESNIPASAAALPTLDITPPPLSQADVWIGYCRMGLLFTGACHLLLGVAMLPLFAVLEDGAGSVFFGLMGLAFCAGFGVLNFVAARGLKNGERWAWILSLVLAAMYASSACLPLGIVLLVGLLRSDVRQVFLD